LGLGQLDDFLTVVMLLYTIGCKAHGESIAPIRSEKDIEVIEPDEMHTYTRGVLELGVANINSTAH
jgi:hypothetical protein